MSSSASLQDTVNTTHLWNSAVENNILFEDDMLGFLLPWAESDCRGGSWIEIWPFRRIQDVSPPIRRLSACMGCEAAAPRAQACEWIVSLSNCVVFLCGISLWPLGSWVCTHETSSVIHPCPHTEPECFLWREGLCKQKLFWRSRKYPQKLIFN